MQFKHGAMTEAQQKTWLMTVTASDHRQNTLKKKFNLNSEKIYLVMMCCHEDKLSSLSNAHFLSPLETTPHQVAALKNFFSIGYWRYGQIS